MFDIGSYIVSGFSTLNLCSLIAMELWLQGVTAVLNFQRGIEAENWGLDPKLINESCQKFDILMINYPIR